MRWKNNASLNNNDYNRSSNVKRTIYVLSDLQIHTILLNQMEFQIILKLSIDLDLSKHIERRRTEFHFYICMKINCIESQFDVM